MNQLITWITTVVSSVSTWCAGVDTPQAKTPEWYLNHATKCMKSVNSQVSHPTKVKLYFRQCAYLAKELETAIQKSRQALDRSSSPEHTAECRGALKLLYQLAKEVERFIRECCNDKTLMQAALTPASVPERVSLWRCHLKVCTELLCNSNKLGAAWLTTAQHGGMGEAELLAIKKMASDDECDLMRLLKSMLGQSSDLQPHVFMGNVELVTILLDRLKARQAMPTLGTPQSPYWEDRDELSPWKVDSEALPRGEKLGRGGSGTVFKGEWFGVIPVAIRDLSGMSFKPISSMTTWPSHPNLTSFLGYMVNKESCSLIWELMEEDLRTLMERRMQEDGNCEGPFSIWEACDIMLQLAEGVRCMHQNRVLHRALKSCKILVRSFEDDEGEHVCAKVTDSPIPKWIEKSTTYSEQTQNAGTTRWMAPELMRLGGLEVSNSTHDGLKHPFKSDVYSFGILCYEILTGESPFSSEEVPREVRRMVLDGFRPTLPETVPQSVRNLIKLCWDPEPITRPSFDKICEELRYIRCSLLLEPQDHTPQLRLPVLEPLHLPLQVSKLKGEYSSLKVVRKLGTGGSDIVTVYLSTWLQSEIKHVAQKRFMGSYNECFKNEVSIMAGLEHSNVVRLLYYASDRRSCSIVMELMDEDLHNLMVRRKSEGKLTPTGPFSMEDAIHIILQIAQGMEYVHGKCVVHRDLKSCNILVKTPSNGGRLEVKVADFGLSMKLASRRTLLGKEDSGVGTIRWMAPEVTSTPSGSSLYDPFKSDMFSFGMLCYEILVGRVPFYEVQDLDTMRGKVLDGERPSLPEWTPSYLRVLIEKCWSKDASERPTFNDIVRGLIEVRV